MGGIEIYLKNLVCHQAKVMSVSAVVANDSPFTRVECLDGATIVRVGSLGTAHSMPVTPTLPWAIRRMPADLIHLHTPNPGAALALLMSRHAGRVVITHHADTLGRTALRRISDPFVQRVMERAAAVIVTSERYLNSSKELEPYRSKCRIVPLGIEAAGFDTFDPVAIDAIHKRFGSRLVLAVGRLVSFKGFSYLIRGMKEVNGTLLLIGSGPLKSTLHASIAELGIQDKVWMIDNVANALIHPYFQAASVFAMPSITRAESLGIVQLEAMAAGKPVVNTNIPSGVPEVSVHNETGLTVPPGNSEALASAINLLLDDAELRQRLGAAARERVQREFSVEKMIQGTMKVYEAALA